jgi:hypothetical protein
MKYKPTLQITEKVATAAASLKSAQKRATKLLSQLTESRRIASDRAAHEKRILENFEPGNDDAILELTQTRSSRDLHDAGIQRMVNKESHEVLREASDALSALASALTAAVEDQCAAGRKELDLLFQAFGGSQEITAPGGGFTTAGAIAADLVVGVLPAFTNLPNEAKWPTTIWRMHPSTPGEAESTLKDTISNMEQMATVASQWQKQGGFNVGI